MKKEKKKFYFLVQVDGTEAAEGKQLTSNKLRGKIDKILKRYKTFGKVAVYIDATNPDNSISRSMLGVVGDLKYLTGTLYTRLQETNNLAPFYLDLCAIRDAIKRMTNNAKYISDTNKVPVIEELEKKLEATNTVQAITVEQLDTLSVEALHLMAHVIAEQKKVIFDCNNHNIDKKETIAFIKKVAFGITGEAN